MGVCGAFGGGGGTGGDTGFLNHLQIWGTE